VKIKANTLSEMCAVTILNAGDDGDLYSTRYGAIDLFDFDNVEAAVAIKRMLAVKRKRIVIDVVYPDE
jgi:hypothetical protein